MSRIVKVHSDYLDKYDGIPFMLFVECGRGPRHSVWTASISMVIEFPNGGEYRTTSDRDIVKLIGEHWLTDFKNKAVDLFEEAING